MKDQELAEALQARDSKAAEDLESLRLGVIRECQNIASNILNACFKGNIKDRLSGRYEQVFYTNSDGITVLMQITDEMHKLALNQNQATNTDSPKASPNDIVDGATDKSVQETADLLETAWGIIANAGGGNWKLESPEWREAAERWRDRYHKTLPQPPFSCEHYKGYIGSRYVFEINGSWEYLGNCPPFSPCCGKNIQRGN